MTRAHEPTSGLGQGRRPAVFLDRDGMLIEDNGWLRSPTQVVFYVATVPALRRLQEHFRLFIVTNQSGVAKRELTLDEASQVNACVVERLRQYGVQIGAVYCCPHQRSENCACIKPKPFFLEQAAREHGLDLSRSFVIGDHPHDVEFARNAGATGVYVLTGHGRKHRAELRGDATVAVNIAAAAEWILNNIAGTAPHVPTARHPAVAVDGSRRWRGRGAAKRFSPGSHSRRPYPRSPRWVPAGGCAPGAPGFAARGRKVSAWRPARSEMTAGGPGE